jgi:hypothetical protein
VFQSQLLHELDVLLPAVIVVACHLQQRKVILRVCVPVTQGNETGRAHHPSPVNVMSLMQARAPNAAPCTCDRNADSSLATQGELYEHGYTLHGTELVNRPARLS